jgi:hypothetical protein
LELLGEGVSIELALGDVLSVLLEFLFNCGEFGVLEEHLSLEISEFRVELVNSLFEVSLLFVLFGSDVVQ